MKLNGTFRERGPRSLIAPRHRQNISDAMRRSTDQGIKTKYVVPYLLVAALAVAGMAVAREGDPNHDMEVVFDIPRARIIGTATVDAQKGEELSTYRGDLQILLLTNRGQRIAPEGVGYSHPPSERTDPDPVRLLVKNVTGSPTGVLAYGK